MGDEEQREPSGGDGQIPWDAMRELAERQKAAAAILSRSTSLADSTRIIGMASALTTLTSPLPTQVIAQLSNAQRQRARHLGLIESIASRTLPSDEIARIAAMNGFVSGLADSISLTMASAGIASGIAFQLEALNKLSSASDLLTEVLNLLPAIDELSGLQAFAHHFVEASDTIRLSEEEPAVEVSEGTSPAGFQWHLDDLPDAVEMAAWLVKAVREQIILSCILGGLAAVTFSQWMLLLVMIVFLANLLGSAGEDI